MSELIKERQEIMFEIFMRHKEFHDLYNNDPTVHSWLAMYQKGACRFDEAMIGIAVHLAKEKKNYYEQCIELSNKIPSGPVIIRPSEA